MVYASALRVEDLGFDFRLCGASFSRAIHTSDLKIGTPVVHCHVSGVIGSALGLVGLYTVTG